MPFDKRKKKKKNQCLCLIAKSKERLFKVTKQKQQNIKGILHIILLVKNPENQNQPTNLVSVRYFRRKGHFTESQMFSAGITARSFQPPSLISGWIVLNPAQTQETPFQMGDKIVCYFSLCISAEFQILCLRYQFL